MVIEQGKRFGLVLLTALFVAASSSSAFATILLPGQFGVPVPTVSVPASPTFVAFTPGIVFSDGAGFTGIVYSAVTVSNTYGAGSLDFYYQVENTSSPVDIPIQHINFGDFANAFTGPSGYVTDVYYRPDTGDPDGGGSLTGCCASGGFDSDSGTFVAPLTADRTGPADGSGVTFNFPGIGAIPTGASSDIMVIKTNATLYDFGGTAGILDTGHTGAVIGILQPTGLPVPEPGSLILLGSGLLGLSALARRRRQRNAQ